MSRPISLLLAWMLTTSTATFGETLVIGDFSRDLTSWEERSFSGNTRYRTVEKQGRMVLEAHAEGTASALYRTQHVDLRNTPYLHWRWRVDETFEGIDERTRAGDDYAARIYVVRRGGIAFWRTRALSYVWSSNQPVGTRWPNAYAGDNVQMWAVNSGKEQAGEWVHHVRDVRTDFRKAFDMEIDTIDGIALMTDADDTGASVTAWYAEIWFSESADR